jgi:hypothetical protein
MCMLFGYGAASTRPPELLRFGWCKAAGVTRLPDWGRAEREKVGRAPFTSDTSHNP